MSSSPKTVQRRGVESQVLTIVIADETGQIKLQLWDGQIPAAKVAASYSFTNLSVREYGSEKFITTTKQSAIVEINKVPVPDNIVPLAIQEEDALQTVETEVVAIKLSSNFNCRSCYKRQSPSFSLKEPFYRCEGCQLLRKSTHFLATTSGVLHAAVDGVETALTLNNSVLRSFLEKEHLTHLLEDTESLEMYLLRVEKLQVSFNAGRFVTKLCHLHHASAASSSAVIPATPTSALGSLSPLDGNLTDMNEDFELLLD